MMCTTSYERAVFGSGSNIVVAFLSSHSHLATSS